MRVSAHQYDVDDAKAKRHARILRHNGDEQGSLFGLQVRLVFALQPDDAAVGLQDPAYQAKKGRLPRTVGAHDTDELARTDFKIELIYDSLVAVREGELFNGKHERNISDYIVMRLLRRSRYRKKGAPQKAVTMPTGSSVGLTTVLATRSARMRKAAPTRADMGNRKR